ncbi:C39 family peptidase [Teredinibacter purpureus]|uniref:C39 family peptidase n=1 Tax=Teredinibacter purpureus TaxID=2731756 RepID=UPI0005F83E62|nr:C39 family peptidase [Teredinibacter purpureus]
MLIKSNKKYSGISRPLKNIRKAFIQGDSQLAFKQISTLRKAKQPLLRKSSDYFLLRDVCHSVGRPSIAQALLRIAARVFPDSASIQISRLLITTYSNRSIGLLDQMESLKPLCKSADDEALWYSAIARVSAGLGMMASSLTWINQSRPLLKRHHREAWYHFSLAHTFRRDWAGAVSAAETLVEIDPCAENNIVLIRALLSNGDLEKAKSDIAKLDTMKGQSYLADSYCVQFYYFIGDISKAIRHLESMSQRWPDIEPSAIEKTMVNLYWLHGDVQAAKALGQKTGDPIFESLVNADLKADRKLIALPIMTQAPLMCVPTTVAMVASAFGKILSDQDLFSDMHGRNGTEIWRMQDHMESIGFDVIYLRPEYTAVKACIDKGQPLIGPTASLFGAHVEVIAGYDEGLGGVFIRDPESLTPYFTDKTYLDTAYKASGNYLIAIAPKSKLDWLPESYKHTEAQHLIALKRTISLGEVTQAREHFTAINDDIGCNYLRDVYGFGVFLSPLGYQQAMKKYAEDPLLDEVSRIQAVIGTQDSDFIYQWITSFRESKNDLAPYFGTYLDLILARSKREYDVVLEKLSILLSKNASTEALWSYKAEAKLELGDIEDAKKSIQIALDIAPTSYDVRRRIRDISPYQEPYEEKVASVRSQISEYPDIFELEEELADILGEGEDGLAYEQAILSCINRRPLIPWTYNKLADWYLNQHREDLAKNILEQGRESLSEQELPKRYFEQNEANSEDDITPKEQSVDNIETNHPSDSDRLKNIVANWFNGHLPTEDEKQLLITNSELDHFDLSWWEKAYILAINFALTDLDNENRQKKQPLTDSLPTEFPHKTTLMILAFNRAAIRISLSVSACQILYDWEKELLKNDTHWRYDIAFDLAYLRELAGFLNEAQDRYKEIIDRTPGYYAPYYRMACVYEKKGMKKEAVRQYHSCLDIAPSHMGAVNGLIDVFSSLNDYASVTNWCHYASKLSPYDYDCIQRWLDFIAHVDGIETAFTTFNSSRNKIHPCGEKVLRARLLQKQGKYDEAVSQLDLVIDGYNYDRAILVERALCANGKEDWKRVLELANEALKKSSTDLWFIEVKLAALESTKSTEIRGFISQQIKNGCISDALTSSWLRLTLEENDSATFVKEKICKLIEAINSDYVVDFLLRYFTGYFYQNNSASLYSKWLDFCEEESPESLYFVERRVEYLFSTGKSRQAFEIVKSYSDAHKDNAGALMLMGRILEDESPFEAIKYLRSAYKKSGDVECLSRIGRAYHVMGRHNDAVRVYREVIEKNPMNDLSVNNLMVLGEDPKYLYSKMVDIINNGLGYNTEYFLVNTLKAARKIKTTVPINWFNLAEYRLSEIEKTSGFHDELPLLGKALYTWYKHIDEKEKAKEVLKKASLNNPLLGFFFWPGKKWMPETAASESNGSR